METGLRHTMQKQQENSIFKTYFKELSIQINLDGLSFCIFNPVLNYVEAIYNFPINFNYKTKQDIEQEIYAVLESEEDLRQDFNNIKVYHNTPIFTFIPQALFNGKKNAIEYLKYSIDVSALKENFVEYDRIVPIDTVNVYIPDILINNILIEYYGAFEYQHFSSSLLRMLLRHYASHAYEIMYVYAEQNSFYFVMFRDKKLYYFNRFEYQTFDDLLYYILFTIEQLNINPERVPLYFIGDMNINVLICERIQRYIKYIYLMKYNKSYFSEGMDEGLIHQNFVLTQSF
ncbi:DUF3822 family protein [Capnocytophaga sp.]|uniref:DUF3822 family protein n=1 Tax=Capnocytophaga sp. TaxID=44737 RepID=UPI0026DA7FEF|nr:DUF3822 family protein [Capnocytophaga sp.]MDO5104555.1 DUF3822 family protein [Capnocytophaga sp.]